MMSTEATVEDTPLEVSIVDDRVGMTADVDETLSIQTPDVDPLGQFDPVLVLSVAGDGAAARITLGAEAVRTLADVLEAIDR